jgi:hypothetical protein
MAAGMLLAQAEEKIESSGRFSKKGLDNIRYHYNDIGY